VNRRATDTTTLAELIDGYARRVYPAILEQHAADSVSSPLGIWLLLAASASGAEGERRASLERLLGCSAELASELLAHFVADPPPALKVAVALWIAGGDATQAARDWANGLPSEVETGPMPTKAEADDWARRNTFGLIDEFPIEIDPLTRIVLASALATKVSWRSPFDVVGADGHLGPASGWRGVVRDLLWDKRPSGHAAIVNTQAAGLVAVHCAIATEELAVISVSADPDRSRETVLDAAHEVIARLRGDQFSSLSSSLFELPLGDGHSWEITEREVATVRAGERKERIAEVTLPAWKVKSDLDLLKEPQFGAEDALLVLQALIGPRQTDQFEAKQTAVASYTRFGFEAAAVTAIGIRAMAVAPPRQRGIERAAALRFDHPYAAIAVAGAVADAPSAPATAQDFGLLALFTAWVHTPLEPEDEPGK
jgi:Serpin (serine protease inhibitor)